MEALYIKQKTTYANGNSTDYSFVRISKSGKITSVSKSLNRISQPKSVMLKKGFEIITQKEFDDEVLKITKLMEI